MPPVQIRVADVEDAEERQQQVGVRVCNRRQSVLCVHASGYCATDQRRFVQDISLGLGLAGCRGSARRAPEGEEADGLFRVPG